jgi:hypothetical protein
MKEGYPGSPDNLYKDSIAAITNFLKAHTRSLKRQFTEGLEALRTVIENKGTNINLGLYVNDELSKGRGSKLIRLTANLSQVTVTAEGYPKWKMHFTHWTDSAEFEKDLLNKRFLGGKNTRKNKNTKRRKSRKH